MFLLAGLIVNAQPLPWLTVNVWPAIVSVPLRAGPLFAATLNSVEPGPFPLEPEVIVIHDALLDAIHPQPPLVDTAAERPFAALGPGDALDGLIENAQLGGAAAWLTVNVWPAIVSVPVRATPLFAATLKTVEPGPLPLEPDVIVIQDALLAAFHPQPLPVDTLTETPVAPPAPGEALDELIENEQDGGVGAAAAAWLTVTTAPAIVRVPVRATLLFPATVKVTVPLPAPAAADVTVIQGALLAAVHMQPDPVVMAADSPEVPAAGAELVSGATVYGHVADWLTVYLSPATVTVPLRGPPSFDATWIVTLPLPAPAAPAVTEIQLTSLFAVHAHPLPAVTENTPDPPATPMVWSEGESLYWHAAPC